MANNFENLNRAKTLMRDSNSLKTFHDRFNEITGKSNIDKDSKGFNVDSRLKAFNINVYFSSYTGSYGSSNVSEFIRVYGIDDVNGALIEYLRNNEEKVIKGMAIILAEKAKSLIDAAKDEINTANNSISEIEKYNAEINEETK